LYTLLFSERFNKKCKNLTANKHEPITSLANALVRDGTSRYFRWRRRASPTRECKIPKTEAIGTSTLVDVSDNVLRMIQVHLLCGCQSVHSSVYSHQMVLIGGARFNANEKLILKRRCGSVVTMVRDRRSVYGLIKRIYRVVCTCHRYVDLLLVSWFPVPHYPDNDPLTIRIGLNGLDVNNITELDMVPVYDIQPSRVGVEIDVDNDCMFMLRMDGIDTMSLT